MFKGDVKAGAIDEALNTVGVLVDDCKIRFTDDCLHIIARDPSNITSAKIELKSSAFESFESNEGTIGVNIARLRKIIQKIDSEQIVHLEAEKRNLEIQIDGIDHSLRLASPDVIGDSQDFVEFELPASATLRSEKFSKIVDITEIVADKMILGVDESENLLYASANSDYGDVRVEFNTNELLDIELEHVQSVFSIDYIKSITDISPNDTVFSISLGEKSPIEISYDFVEGDGHAIYHVAPRY